MLARSSGATPARMASNRAGSDRWAASPAWITAPQGMAPSGVAAETSMMITRTRSGREERQGRTFSIWAAVETTSARAWLLSRMKRTWSVRRVG